MAGRRRKKADEAAVRTKRLLRRLEAERDEAQARLDRQVTRLRRRGPPTSKAEQLGQGRAILDLQQRVDTLDAQARQVRAQQSAAASADVAEERLRIARLRHKSSAGGASAVKKRMGEIRRMAVARDQEQTAREMLEDGLAELDGEGGENGEDGDGAALQCLADYGLLRPIADGSGFSALHGGRPEGGVLAPANKLLAQLEAVSPPA